MRVLMALLILTALSQIIGCGEEDISRVAENHGADVCRNVASMLSDNGVEASCAIRKEYLANSK